MFNANFPPVMTIESGDRVEVQCVSGRKSVMPPPDAPFIDPAGTVRHHRRQSRGAGRSYRDRPDRHRRRDAGDTLEIRIEKIVPGADWGYNVIRPLAGTLPEDFHETTLMHIPVDIGPPRVHVALGHRTGDLAPFFGVMGVAPPPEFGTIASKEPRIHGGNLDNKEMTAGSTLFLPVWVPGANFSVGDGHGVQGDGEVCVTALEMCLTGTFTFILHKGRWR